MLDPKEIENERCEAMAVIRIESICMTGTHTTLQAKVDEVGMDFERVVPKSIIPVEVEVEGEEEEFEDEF